MSDLVEVPFASLIGKTITSISSDAWDYESRTTKSSAAILGEDKIEILPYAEAIMFFTTDGGVYRMYHSQDCCESVRLEDVIGDLKDLIGSPILHAEVVTNSESFPEDAAPREYPPESFTWTFYKLSTILGSVTLRWLGESNGYYSESVYFYGPKPKEEA